MNRPESGEPEPTVDLRRDTSNETARTGDRLAETQSHSGSLRDVDFAGDVPPRLGRYEIRRLLGKGGFGAVYEGFDTQLGRRVAIKVPKLGSTDTEVLAEFTREAQRLAQLKHPGIVTVHDIGVEDGHCHIVSDYVDGVILEHWMAESKPGWAEVAEVVAKVADTLAYAHANGTIHRDIKPANIILTSDMQPVLLDFGLALSEQDGVRPEDFVSGTPGYMSPEQALAKAHRIDGRTDIYSLGVVLYEMLLGRRPFRGQNLRDILRQIVEDEPQPPRQIVRDIPPELERICLKAMSKEIGDRYSNAGDMADELRALLSDSITAGISATTTRKHASQIRPAPSSEKVRPAAFTQEAERRQLTLMVCNCALLEEGLLLESLDPEDQHELLLAYRSLCEEVVSRYEGTIVQSTGQELLTCFGYPVAQEDAAHRGVSAALEIRQGMTDLNQRLEADGRYKLAAWQVVHSGPVIVGKLDEEASGDPLSLVGEARNVVARLEQTAEVGVVLISGATKRLVEGFFVCESLDSRELRGIPQPLEVFGVLRASDAHSRVDAAQQTGLTPLIGRDTELSILKDRWEQAAEGMGQVVLLIGDAGLGKSRLVHEIKAHLEAEGDAAIVEWRCSANHQISGLYPTTDFFERLLKFGSSDRPGERLQRLADQLAEVGMADSETIALFASLLSVPLNDRYPALTLTPQRLMDKTHAVVLEWLQAFSAAQPVMFIVEDLHWIDPSTLELLEKLVEEGFHDNMLLVFTFRPEFSTPWTSRAHQTQVALNRLTRRQVESMMRNRLGVKQMPEGLALQVVERTDGIPLFVEEYAKTISESNHLIEVDGQLQLSEEFSLDEIPTTLQDLLIARLERMASVKEVVQLGAAIGREFTWELLSKVSSLDTSALEVELTKLVDAELLFRKGRPPNQSYMFKHALIQDAAYNALLKKKRQQFHQRIGTVLEEQFPETVSSEPELLAHHFTAAGNVEQGIKYWLEAGQRSQERFASLEAIDQLRRGVALVGSLAESPQRLGMELQFQIPLTVNLMAAKGYANPEVQEVQRRSRELCEQIGEGSPIFHVLMGMWATNLILEDLDRCMQICDDVLALAESQDDRGMLTEAHWARVCTLLFLGNFEECLWHAQKGLEYHDVESSKFHAQFTSQNSGVCLFVYLALAHWYLGYPDSAVKALDEGVELDAQLGHLFTRSVLLFHRAYLNQMLGRPEATIEASDKLIAHANEQGYPFFVAAGNLFKGGGLVLAGDYQAAREHLLTADQLFEMTGAKWGVSHLCSSLAETYLALGKVDEAIAAIDRGMAHIETLKGRYEESILINLKGEWLLASSPPRIAEAEQCFRRAIEVAQEQKSKSLELRFLTRLVRHLRDHGEVTAAREMLQTTYDWFTEGHDTRDLQEARQLLNET